MDFMADHMADGRAFRLLDELDDFNRGRLRIEIDFLLPADRVIRRLDRIMEWRGQPGSIRVDNDREYFGGKLLAWAEQRGISVQDNQPGKPHHNTYFKRYNRTARPDWPNRYITAE